MERPTPPPLSPTERRQIEQMRRVLGAPGITSMIEEATAAHRQYESWAARALATLSALRDRVASSLATVPWDRVLALFLEYQLVVPSNIRGPMAIRALMAQRADSGVPLAWVVPAELVVDLVDLRDQPEEQLRLALRHQDEILDQCELVLSGLGFPAADRMREAIACLREGHPGPAQSHAANVFDSIVLAVFAESHPRKERKIAAEIGGSPPPHDDEVTVRTFVDRIVLGPAASAFTEWYPARQDPPPEGFARHPTAHAAHLDGVFTPQHALVAVMLATSLTVHYRQVVGPPGSFEPHSVPGLTASSHEGPSDEEAVEIEA